MITEPTVYFLGQHMLNTTEFLKAVEELGGLENYKNRSMLTGQDADKLVEFAGRVCYQSFKKGRQSDDYHDHIRESGHGSVSEHTYFTFYVKGVSRSLTHDWVRHRHLSPSQRSQRFVDESGIEYVIPPLYLLFGEDDRKQAERFLKVHQRVTQYAYDKLVALGDKVVAEMYPNLTPTERRKRVRESARCVLPNASETGLVMSGNARAWRHYLKLRGNSLPDLEIHRLALRIAHILKRESAHLFSDISFKIVPDKPHQFEIEGIWEGSGEVRALKKRIAELEEQVRTMESMMLIDDEVLEGKKSE